MNEQPTCGEGLAANSVLPAAMAEVLASLSTVLAVHLDALDLADENARQEHAAYSRLTQEYRGLADSLRATATRMSSYRELPMARHDMNAMTGLEPAEAFGHFVNREQALLAVLQARLPGDHTMLASMREAVARGSRSGG